MAAVTPIVTKTAPGQTARHGIWPFGTAQKMTEQRPKVIITAAPSKRTVSIALMLERPKGSLSVLLTRVASTVGTKMLAVVLLFIAASIFVPTLESTVISSTDRLPLGLSDIKAIDTILLLTAALLVTFGICCVIFWAVPKGHMPWRAVWPGAAFVTLTASIANWAFPFYLSNVSDLSRFGPTLGFVLITLIWFYALSLALMAGAVINSLRHELHETGEMPYGPGAEAKKPCGCEEEAQP